MLAVSIAQSLMITNQSKSVNELNAYFLYPKVVIIENRRKVIIVNINSEVNDDKNEKHEYELELNFAHGILQDHFLWLCFNSNELLVVNVYECTAAKIRSDNYANYNIRQFIKKENTLFLISDGGECLAAPFSTKELDNKIKEGHKDIVVALEKVNICRSFLKSQSTITLSNGLNAYIESGKIIVNCAKTGIKDVLSTTVQIENIVPWGNSVILSDKNNMWIFNLKGFEMLFQFPNTTSKYYPLLTKKNTFYYLLWDKEKVQVHSASISQNEELDESETLRKDTNINVFFQDSLKIQLNSIVDTALTKGKPAEVLPQLKPLFNSITDYIYLVNTATKLCKQNITYKVIVYHLQSKIFDTNDRAMINLICDLTNKIDLLEYILFRGNNLYSGYDLFDQNYIQLCVLFLSKSDLDLASICWLKYSELILEIKPEDILNILKAIPCNIKIGALMIWLHKFVPTILEQNPFNVDLFVKWSTERVFLLEQSLNWPKTGSKFIQDIIIVLEKSIKTISVRPISMDDLDVLKDHINYIMELKEKYKINLLLSELSSQNPTEVVIIMLRRCYTEDLEDFLQNHLPNYASRHLFELDDILYSFIESEAATSGGSFDGVRLKMLLNAFRSMSSRLDCLLQVLKVLDVPWNKTIIDIAVKAAASANEDFRIAEGDKALAKEIHKELNYANLKVVLKKYNFHLTCTDYNLVLHKIINAPVVDLNDLKIITTVLPAYANISTVLFIHKCLQNYETKAALNYFKQLSDKEQKILIRTIINKYELIVTRPNYNIVLERNFIDFLKATQSVNSMQIQRMENLYFLKNLYGMTLNPNDLYNENKVDAWIGFSASSGKGRCLMQLAHKHVSRNAPIVLLRRTSTSQNVREVIESMLTLDNYLKIISIFKDGNNSTLLIECKNVLLELALNCDEEYVHSLMNIISVLNSLINTNVVLKNLSVVRKLHYLFLPISSDSALNELIEFYNKINSKKIDMESEISNICNRNDFIPFKMIAYLVTEVHELKNLLKSRDVLVKKLLSKIISSQCFDNLLVTILLIILSHFENNEDKMWLVEVLRMQSETLSPSVIRYLSAPVTRNLFDLNTTGNLITYPPQYVLKSKFNIELSKVALPDCTEETWDTKVVLFHVLKQNPNTNQECLLDICHTLNLSFNDGLSLLLISVLINWELKYKLSKDDLNCHGLILENNELELISKSFIIWESIENKTFIQDILNDFWKNGEVILHGSVISINPYYYEVYFCIYHLLFGSRTEFCNNKEYFLLYFLKYYKRKGIPKQYEYEMFSLKGTFPEIGFYRLPFHLFMREEMWSHLKSEITLETYERWLPVVAILSLDKDLQIARDMICSNAVKQTMTSRTKSEQISPSEKENEQWRLTLREELLLRTAHKCVRHIANMEWAGACLFYVLQGCARGADQVAAAHLCFQFSQRWAALQPGNRAVRQMERLHSTLSTRHVLHKIDWASEELIRLSTEPTQLIQAMYLHPDFVNKISRHDVNRAVNEIADKNSININSIRMQILENILDNAQSGNTCTTGLNTKELITAKYVLKATCPKMGAIYLSRIAFDDECDFNKCKKLRAFQCLMSVVDPDTAIKVINNARDSLWHLLLELLYVVKIEKIDMPWIVATFIQDKTVAIKQILQVASGDLKGLKIAAELAHRYGDVQIIQDLIPLLLQASLFEEMIPLLLKCFYLINNITCAAWRSTILTPFRRADYPLTECQKIKCLNVLNLLPVCPLIKDEDLVEIWKNCVRCKCLGLGCLVLPYMTTQTRQKLTELQRIDKRNLIISLKNLQTKSYLASGAMIVIENIGSKPHR